MAEGIDSIHDIEVEHVQTAHDFNQLVSELREYSEERKDYKGDPFGEMMLSDLEAISESVYRQLAVVYAQAQDQAVDPTDVYDAELLKGGSNE